MTRRRNERGIALPSPIALVSLAAVVLAGVAFVTTSGDPANTGESGEPADAARPVTSDPSPTPSRSAKQPTTKQKRDKAPKAAKSAEPSKPSKSSEPPEPPKPPKASESPKTPKTPKTSETPEAFEIPETERPKEKKEPVRRSEVYVEVYNNSGITGLAGTTASTIAGAGWQVVGSDNWYGTIPASTVYYPERLQVEAQALARDLGIARIMPAISPMRFDRLTVILTTDYS